MLHGTRIVLRARKETDVAVLDAQLMSNVETYSRARGGAWRPLPLGGASEFASREPNDHVAHFTIADRSTDEVLGATLLWQIDLHNRSAHIGLSLLPAARGHGLGTEALWVLCRYGFMTLGLHRLQLETLTDNEAMRGAAVAAGFSFEGTLREGAWVDGSFLDDVVYGQLAREWIARGEARPAPNG